MFQQIVVFLLIAMALFFAVRRLINRFKKRSGCTSCHGSTHASTCEGCALSKKE